MTQKLDFPERKRIRHRSGKRVLFHFVLFAVIAVTLLVCGIIGRVQLNRITDETIASVRVETLISEATEQVRGAASDAADAVNTKQKRNVTNGISGKTKSVKASAEEMLASGKSEAEVAAYIVDTLSEAAVSKLSAEKEDQAPVLTAVQQKLAEGRDGFITAAVTNTDSKVSGMNAEDVRKGLSSNTPNYFFMFYSNLMLIIGGIFLVLALGMGVLQFFCSEDVRKKASDIIEPLDYLLPFFFGVIVFTLYPMVRVFIMAFQERYKLTGEFAAWGLGNFTDVLFGTNTKLPQAVGNTFLYVLLTVPIAAAISIVLAYLLNQKIKLRALFQTAYFLPMVTSATAVGLVWKFMFHENYGIINWLYSLVGGSNIAWLSNPAFSMAVMVIYGVWDSLPMTIILLISGLQNIDEHYYTVAKVDGAHAKRIFFRITVPLLSPTIGLVLIINSISAFKVFNSVIVLFSGNPGPMYNMYTMTYYIYEQINTSLEYGRAAAASLILFVIILIFTMLQRFVQRKWNYT